MVYLPASIILTFVSKRIHRISSVDLEIYRASSFVPRNLIQSIQDPPLRYARVKF